MKPRIEPPHGRGSTSTYPAAEPWRWRHHRHHRDLRSAPSCNRPVLAMADACMDGPTKCQVVLKEAWKQQVQGLGRQGQENVSTPRARSGGWATVVDGWVWEGGGWRRQGKVGNSVMVRRPPNQITVVFCLAETDTRMWLERGPAIASPGTEGPCIWPAQDDTNADTWCLVEGAVRPLDITALVSYIGVRKETGFLDGVQNNTMYRIPSARRRWLYGPEKHSQRGLDDASSHDPHRMHAVSRILPIPVHSRRPAAGHGHTPGCMRRSPHGRFSRYPSAGRGTFVLVV